jgi:hypothetical protein
MQELLLHESGREVQQILKNFDLWKFVQQHESNLATLQKCLQQWPSFQLSFFIDHLGSVSAVDAWLILQELFRPRLCRCIPSIPISLVQYSLCCKIDKVVQKQIQ